MKREYQGSISFEFNIQILGKFFHHPVPLYIKTGF